ncbi:hypothetical protein ScPMuIL_000140 [Solemya velum]
MDSRKSNSADIQTCHFKEEVAVSYLGILDSGLVKGLKLTQYQKDHVCESVHDTVSRYNPPVKRHRYKIKIIPVISQNSSEEDRMNQCTQSNSEQYEREYRARQHRIRSHKYCWCDEDAVAQVNCGVIAADYVIEIKVHAWDPDDPRNQEDACGRVAKLHPLHEDEEGNIHFRCQASLVQYSLSEIALLSRQEVHDRCREEKRRLQEELRKLSVAQCDGSE